jgi:hypothetical protein
MKVTVAQTWVDGALFETTIHVEANGNHAKIRVGPDDLKELTKSAKTGRRGLWNALRRIGWEEGYPASEEGRDALLQRLKEL